MSTELRGLASPPCPLPQASPSPSRTPSKCRRCARGAPCWRKLRRCRGRRCRSSEVTDGPPPAVPLAAVQSCIAARPALALPRRAHLARLTIAFAVWRRCFPAVPHPAGGSPLPVPFQLTKPPPAVAAALVHVCSYTHSPSATPPSPPSQLSQPTQPHWLGKPLPVMPRAQERSSEGREKEELQRDKERLCLSS